LKGNVSGSILGNLGFSVTSYKPKGDKKSSKYDPWTAFSKATEGKEETKGGGERSKEYKRLKELATKKLVKKDIITTEMSLKDDTKYDLVPDETRGSLNIVFIGHVDHGKSTICGNILVLTGKVDKDDIRKLELEAKDKKRESWYLAYIMDINEEEKAKGKTVEVGKALF